MKKQPILVIKHNMVKEWITIALWQRNDECNMPITADAKGSCISRKLHDDVIKWKHFPRYWPFVKGIYRWPVDNPHKGRWRAALALSLIWTNGWTNDWDAVIWEDITLWRNCNVIYGKKDQLEVSGHEYNKRDGDIPRMQIFMI